MADDDVRGSNYRFSAKTFVDFDGAAVAPASCSLTIDYPLNKARVKVTVAMDLAAGVFTKVWDSSVSDAGKVDWFMEPAGSNVRVKQGSFKLAANRANPAPA